MELSLKNIGKISAASVEINGITVIAGENNTGKSTIGRALFAMFNSFCNIQKQIESARINSIEGLLDRLYYTSSLPQIRIVETGEIARTIVSSVGEHGTDSAIIEKKIFDFFESYSEGIAQKLDHDVIDKTIIRIKEVLEVSEGEVLKSLLEKNWVQSLMSSLVISFEKIMEKSHLR